MSLHLVLLLVYSVLLVLLGLRIGRRVRATGEFFVAGRKLGPGLLFSTMVAANIGAGSTVGAAGLGYRDGIGAWWWVGSAGIGSLVLGFFVGPRIRAIAQAHGLHTVGDYLEQRYSRGVRGTIAALLWLGALAILAGQLIALAWVLEVARGAAVAGGALRVTIASVAPTVIGALSIFYTLFSVSLFVPVIAGLYLRRVGTAEALAAIGSAAVALLPRRGRASSGA